MSGKIRTYCLSIVLVISVSSQAAYAGCLTEQQVRADQIKFVQASLTAAAMTCQGNRRDEILKIYNLFIGRYRSEILGSLTDLALYYRSETSANYRDALDQHIIRQTNSALVGGREMPDFCQTLLMKTADLAATPQVDSLQWVDEMPIHYEPVIKACKSQEFPQLASSE